MKQFLIREFTDSTGYVHVNVEQPRENERMTLVEAKDKEEAKDKVEGLLNYIKPPKASWCWLEDEYKRLGIFDKE
ncbi:DUF1381 domain-containing protein [Staphylococcus haemolyticus]|uniref:DUF1381 domain-containing protein n=1 Tax=Staphylococcus haemolyticus TaxID=1283 RepID=UPI000D1F8161|nr:DUF1381 domain-containing protein [Staphylococcus haemolyticus]PTK42120.1 DUF1381 domain-containing protein [Staphylococcus haemolyticus]PTK77172.1 DUF1381 domain-containing protein [Staphylococcus haemolyticus]